MEAGVAGLQHPKSKAVNLSAAAITSTKLNGSRALSTKPAKPKIAVPKKGSLDGAF